jgi:hypothetical protein
LNAENLLYSSTNLVNWTSETLGIETTSPVGTNSVTKPKDPAGKFHRMLAVNYTSPRPVPKNVYGRTLILNFTGGDQLRILFDSAGTGIFYWNGAGPGAVAYYWNQDAYRGRLQPIYYSAALYPMDLHLDFLNAASGNFSGKYYNTPSGTPVSGTYTISGP